MSIIFNTVKTYVESVGRQRSYRPWNTLDSMTSIFTGPTNQVGSWIPQPGSKHPNYGNMFANGSDLVDEVAGVTTLRCSYVGKFYDVGKPSVGSSTHQGEISWTSFAGTNTYIVTQGIPAGGQSGSQQDSFGSLIPEVFPVYGIEFVSFTWLARYIITAAIYKTLTRNPGTTIGNGGGSWEITSKFRTGRVSNASGNGMISAGLTFPSVLLDSSVNPLNNGWFEVSSTWGPQPEIVTTLLNIPTPINNLGAFTLGLPLS